MELNLNLLLFVGCFLIVTCSAHFIPNPLHASCKVKWNVGVDCEAAGKKIEDQLEKWKGTDCGNGEKCRYTFVSSNKTTVLAKHTTPVHEYVDDLTWKFAANGTDCAIDGFSTSETWYAVLDYGTNYCNLQNIMDGSGLSATDRYLKVTNDNICTQYSSANCEKY